jgi:Ni/Fe-hydrogenase subunit HybB-like protein
MHESNFYVIGFSYGSNTCDAVGRVSRTRAAFVVAATAAFSCILAATSSSWILAATASSWPSRLEFQHSYPTFG